MVHDATKGPTTAQAVFAGPLWIGGKKRSAAESPHGCIRARARTNSRTAQSESEAG